MERKRKLLNVEDYESRFCRTALPLRFVFRRGDDTFWLILSLFCLSSLDADDKVTMARACAYLWSSLAEAHNYLLDKQHAEEPASDDEIGQRICYIVRC